MKKEICEKCPYYYVKICFAYNKASSLVKRCERGEDIDIVIEDAMSKTEEG